MAHLRHSRPASGPALHVKVLKNFKLLPLRSEAVALAIAKPPKALRGGISKVNFQETLSIFGDTFPQNGSKNGEMAPRTGTGYPHIGPFVAGVVPLATLLATSPPQTARVLEVLISPNLAQRHALHVERTAVKAFMLSDLSKSAIGLSVLAEKGCVKCRCALGAPSERRGIR